MGECLMPCCSSWLITSGSSNGCLCLGGSSLTQSQKPCELLRRSLNWNGFLKTWVIIPGCKFWTACWVQTICQQMKENCNCCVFYQGSIGCYGWILSPHICCVCVCLYLCMWLSLLSPYHCPLKPSFPVGSWRNWMKNMAGGASWGLDYRARSRAQRASLDTSPSIKNQNDSGTHSIPAAERNNVPRSQSRCFLFPFKEHAFETRLWLKNIFTWSSGTMAPTPPPCFRGACVRISAPGSRQRDDCVRWARAH